MTIQEQIQVMQHFANGGKVERKSDDCWEDISRPNWDWLHNDYRIKQEPSKQEIVFTKNHPTISTEDFVKIVIAVADLKHPMMYKITIEEIF